MTVNQLSKELKPFNTYVMVEKDILNDKNLFGKYIVTLTNSNFDVDISTIKKDKIYCPTGSVNNPHVQCLVVAFTNTPILKRHYQKFTKEPIYKVIMNDYQATQNN